MDLPVTKLEDYARALFASGDSQRALLDCGIPWASGIEKRLEAHPIVKAEIARLREEARAVAKLSPGWLIRRWMDIVEADPDRLAGVRRYNCRHCWGIEHGYQWTQPEFEDAVCKAIALQMPSPEMRGGVGFKVTGEPNKDCPQCGGNGVPQVVIGDTRRLGKHAALYLGAKQTRHGIEVQMADKGAAMKALADYLGMNKTELAVTVKKSDPDDMTDDELMAVIRDHSRTSSNDNP